MSTRAKARFVAPMLLQRMDMLPDDAGRWAYELKLDGYRAIAGKTNGAVRLWSRNGHSFNTRYPAIVRGLSKLPDETLIDGEVVALDADGRPSFNALQNVDPSASLVYYVFDVIVLKGRDLTGDTLDARRAVLETKVLPTLTEPVRYAGELKAGLSDLLASVRSYGLEGLVAKRRDSRYEAGRRSGAWLKMRVNRGQEFVIGGYSRGPRTFDALVVGYYEGDELRYVARTRNGFTPLMRAQLFKKFNGLEIDRCPFVNLPEERSGRWGQGLTKAKMAECQWLKPVLVGRFEFLEWTADNHLRHSKFVGLRSDKKAGDVRRE